jgi:hypothetical protein
MHHMPAMTVQVDSLLPDRGANKDVWKEWRVEAAKDGVAITST